jgi:hypothetical protein
MIKTVRNFSSSPPAFHVLPQTSAVQARNRTTGAAMSLLKECVANNRLPARCSRSRHPVRPAGQPCTANSSHIKQDAPWAGKLTFAQDFTQEHSLPGLHFASIEISGCF